MIKKEELIKQAEKFIRQNSLTQAIEIYSDIVKLYPKDLTAINALGDLQVRINNTEAAKEIFSHLAKEYSNQGFYEIAIAIYKKLLKLSNDSITIGSQIAELYVKQKNFTEAKRIYLKIVQYYRTQNNISDLLSTLEKIANLEPQNPIPRIELATEQANYNNIEKACKNYLIAAEKYIEKKSFSVALNLLNQILLISPFQKEAIHHIVYIYLKTSQADEALRILEKALLENPKNPNLLSLLGTTYLFTQNLDKAEEIFGELLEIDSTKYDGLLYLAQKLTQQNQPERAIKIINKCLEPVCQKKQYKRLINLLKQVNEIYPDYLGALQLLEKIYFLTSQPAKLASVINKIEKITKHSKNRDLLEPLATSINNNYSPKSFILEKQSPLLEDTLAQANLNFSTNTLDNPNKESSYIKNKEDVVFSEDSTDLSDILHSPELDSEKGFITPSNTKDFDLLNKQEIRIPLYALDTSDTLEVLDFVKPYIPSKERLETSSFTNLPSQFDQLSKFSDRATNEFLSDKDLEKALKNEWRRAIRNNKPISLILFELQNNRKEKETLEKNKTLLMLIKQYLFRVGDLVVIYENNLVVILLPDTADYGLKAVISRLIKAIKVVYTQCIGEDFYLSIGQATAYPERKSDPDSLMSLAKESLRKQTSQNLALML